MPLERLPDLPRVVVARIEGLDTLYEFDLTAAPSPAWRAVFLWPPPALTTADHTPDIGRVAIHGRTVHFRAAPQLRGDWLRRIDQWMTYPNSVVERDAPAAEKRWAGCEGCPGHKLHPVLRHNPVRQRGASSSARRPGGTGNSTVRKPEKIAPCRLRSRRKTLTHRSERRATAYPPRGDLATQRWLSDGKHWGVGAPGGTRTPGIRLRSPSALPVFSASCGTGDTFEGTNRFTGQRHRQRLSPPPPGHVQSSPCPPRATITGSPIGTLWTPRYTKDRANTPSREGKAAPASSASRRPLSSGSPSLVQIEGWI